MRKLMLFLCLGITWLSCSASRSVQAEKVLTDSLDTPYCLIDGHYYKKGLSLDSVPTTSIKSVGGVKGNGFSVIKLNMNYNIKNEYG